MKAMILAAGRGERMRPLSDQTPKPLLPVGGKPLIAHHLIKLASIGIHDVVINVAHLAEKIQHALGDGQQYGVKITYSYEPAALETGGGIYQALSFLGTEPFLLLSSDIWTDYPLQNLLSRTDQLAHLILVANPDFKPVGDYDLQNGRVIQTPHPPYTYASFGIIHPQLFIGSSGGTFPLTAVLNPAIAKNKVSGEVYQGVWFNLGTPAQYQQLLDYVAIKNN